MLEAFKIILETVTDALLVVVPRHLERFNRVKSLINEEGFKSSSRSKKEDVTNDVQVLLGDTMGELNFLYSVSDVAFVGGSLIDHGGQNLLEPAAQGLPLCSGPYFIDLINDENKLHKTGQASKYIFMENRGAIGLIKKDLDSHINKVL